MADNGIYTDSTGKRLVAFGGKAHYVGDSMVVCTTKGDRFEGILEVIMGGILVFSTADGMRTVTPCEVSQLGKKVPEPVEEISTVNSIKLDDGKYEILLCDKPFSFRCLRHGEEWRSLTGDGLVLAMAYEILELKEQLEKSQNNTI